MVTIRNIEPLDRGVFVYKNLILYTSRDELHVRACDFVESDTYFAQCVRLINRFNINLVISLGRCESSWKDSSCIIKPAVCLWDPQYTVRGDEVITTEPTQILCGSITEAKPLPLTEEELDYLESLQTLRYLKA